MRVVNLARALNQQVGPPWAVIKMVLAGLLGGAVADVIVGGGGSRIVMRILAINNERLTGVLTGNGNVAGGVTTGGTLELLALGVFSEPLEASYTCS